MSSTGPLTWKSTIAVVTPQVRVVQGLLRRPLKTLSRPQRSHLMGLVLALLSGSTAKLRPLSAPAPRHKSRGVRFIS
jgi:hypothetical protein